MVDELLPFDTETDIGLLLALHPEVAAVTLIIIELFISPLITIFVATACGAFLWWQV